MTPPGTPLGAAGTARLVVTDRDGVRADPARPVRDDPAASRLGAGVAPYERFDLASHVGDDASVVEGHRAALVAALAPGGATGLALMDQVHGSAVAVVDDAATAPRADALVTTRPGLALAVLVADCVPVVLADDAAGVVGAVHAGRKGVRSGVVGAAVAAMVDAGASGAGIHAVVGPAVCAACYEVPAAMRDEVSAVVPEARATSRAGTPALDLRRAVVAQLATAGVGAVETVGGCTAEDASLYSYRRDGRTGRFAMLVWLPDPA